MNYWIFQGNPDVFRIDEYLAKHDRVTWEVNQAHFASEMAIGDEVFFWRAGGSGGSESGIVAVGTIVSRPVVRADDESGVPYWIKGDPSEKRLRVELEISRRCLRPKEMVKRKWLKDDPVLNDLRILKFASETNYKISVNEAERLTLLTQNTGRDWNRDECVAALWAFSETEGGEVSKLASSPVARVAVTIGRAVGGVYNKVMNFRAIDPRDKRAGLSATNEIDHEVWNQFYDAKSQTLRITDLQTEYERTWGRKTSSSVTQRDIVACRICWNSQGWTHPTGEAASLEKGSFVTKYGFGHEEWLANIGWVIDGWHYGFLQPINSAFGKYQGGELDVLLYTIGPGKTRFYVGRINQLHVLTTSQADAAVKEHRERGWFSEMVEQVKSVKGKPKGFESSEVHSLLNIRYRPASLELFVPFDPADDYLNQLPGQYHVYRSKPSSPKRAPKRTRRPKSFNKTALLPHERKGSGTVVANPIEKIMQQEICEHLEKQYHNIEAERDFVDIKIEGPKGITLIELKSSASALQAIRAGLGQVLEYAFVHPEWRQSLFELVVVGQGLATDESKRYIQWLREQYNLPIRYLSYQRGSVAFEL